MILSHHQRLAVLASIRHMTLDQLCVHVNEVVLDTDWQGLDEAVAHSGVVTDEVVRLARVEDVEGVHLLMSAEVSALVAL